MPAVTKALRDDLLAVATTNRFGHRRQWCKSDLLIWDNRSAIHQASLGYDPGEHRSLHRLILKGEALFGPAMPMAG